MSSLSFNPSESFQPSQTIILDGSTSYRMNSQTGLLETVEVRTLEQPLEREQKERSDTDTYRVDDEQPLLSPSDMERTLSETRNKRTAEEAVECKLPSKRERMKICAGKIAVVILVIGALTAASILTAGAASSMLATGAAVSWKVGALYGSSIGLSISTIYSAAIVRKTNMHRWTCHSAADTKSFIKKTLAVSAMLGGVGAVAGSFFGAELASMFGYKFVEIKAGSEIFIGKVGTSMFDPSRYYGVTNIKNLLIDPKYIASIDIRQRATYYGINSIPFFNSNILPIIV